MINQTMAKSHRGFAARALGRVCGGGPVGRAGGVDGVGGRVRAAGAGAWRGRGRAAGPGPVCGQHSACSAGGQHGCGRASAGQGSMDVGGPRGRGALPRSREPCSPA